MLSEEDSDTEDLNQLNINEHYAKAYAYKKEREELGRRESKSQLLSVMVIFIVV